MLFRSIAAAALLCAATPVGAQTAEDPTGLRARVATFVQPTNEARTQAVLDLVRAAGFEPEVETFEAEDGDALTYYRGRYGRTAG